MASITIQSDLATQRTLRVALERVVGYSDPLHSGRACGVVVVAASISAYGCLVEMHFHNNAHQWEKGTYGLGAGGWGGRHRYLSSREPNYKSIQCPPMQNEGILAVGPAAVAFTHALPASPGIAVTICVISQPALRSISTCANTVAACR